LDFNCGFKYGFDAAKVINIQPYPSGNNNSFRYDLLPAHCRIVYIRKPEVVEWIQKKLGVNDNQPKFSIEEKKSILNKLNQAVSLRTFAICRSKTVLLKVESLLFQHWML
jgi:2-oxoglutarate dehydrogenase E1 component